MKRGLTLGLILLWLGASGCANMSPRQQRALSGGAIGAAGGAAVGAIVGGSPYNRTEAELEAFCARLERFLAYATKDLGASPATFTEFRAAWSGSS